MDIAEFVAKNPNGQKVKAEHQKHGGLLQEIQFPPWKLEDINKDIIVVFLKLEGKMTLC